MIRLIAALLVAYTSVGDPPKTANKPQRVPALLAQAQPRAASTLEIIAPDTVPSRSGFAIQARADGVKGLFWLVFPISAEGQLVRIPSFPEGEVNPLIYLGGMDSGELNFVAAGVTASGKAIGASKTVRVGVGPIPPGPTPPGPTPPGPTPPGPTPPGPTPPPPPVPNKYGLAEKVKGWAQNVGDPARAANARGIADAVDEIVRQIGAGTMTTRGQLETALLGLKAKIDAFPGLLVPSKWKVYFLIPMVSATADLFPDTDDAGNPLTYPMSDYAQALSEVATGLRSVQ